MNRGDESMATYSEKLGHELAIYRLLKRAGLSRDMVDQWVTTPRPDFDDKRPIDLMQGTLDDISGLEKVRTYLESM